MGSRRMSGQKTTRRQKDVARVLRDKRRRQKEKIRTARGKTRKD
jgi:hypothetical protein